MQKFMVVALGAASLFAVPALAQTSTGTSTNANNSNHSASAQSTQGQKTLTQAQQKITQDLERDGYKSVRVVPNSFLVHAMNKEGMPVVMIINPDSVFAMTEVGMGNNGSPNSAGNTSHSGLGANPSANGSQSQTSKP